MLSKTTLIALAAAVAATLSISAAQAGMNNVNFTARSPNTIHATPNLPDVKVKPQMIDLSHARAQRDGHLRAPDAL
jgi:hypothetical protein